MCYLTVTCAERILRSENPLTGNVLYLHSHFLTNLIGGKLCVKGFTFKEGKKNIDVFSKKMIILPYNHDNHWTLVVIINPGKIGNYYKYESQKPFDKDEVPM